MAEEENNEAQQELLFKFSMYERQIQELQQQIEAVERGIIDLNTLSFGLDELKGSTGKEILAPIGKGIFINAKVLSEELNVDIGSGNVVKKSIPDTKKLIEEQIEKLSKVKEEMERNLEQIGEEITGMMNQEEHNHHNHEHVHDENCKHNH